MKLPKIKLPPKPIAGKVAATFHYQKSKTIQGYFENDLDRFDSFHSVGKDFLVDFSKIIGSMKH